MESNNPAEPDPEHHIPDDGATLEPAESHSPRKQRVGSESESALRRLEVDTAGGVFEMRCETRIRALAYLVDSEWVQDLVLARIHDDPRLYCSEDPTGLDSVIDRSIHDLVGMQEAEPSEDPPSEEFLEQMRGMGVESQRVSFACKRFNGLPFSLRKTFRVVCLEGVTVDECVELEMGSEEVIGGAIYTCFEALIGDWPLKKVPRSKQPNL